MSWPIFRPGKSWFGASCCQRAALAILSFLFYPSTWLSVWLAGSNFDEGTTTIRSVELAFKVKVELAAGLVWFGIELALEWNCCSFFLCSRLVVVALNCALLVVYFGKLCVCVFGCFLKLLTGWPNVTNSPSFLPHPI